MNAGKYAEAISEFKKLDGYKEISDAQYKAKLAKDNVEYAKINNTALTAK